MIISIIYHNRFLQAHRRKYLRAMASRVTSSNNHVNQQCYVAYMRTIGTFCPPLLAEYRSLFDGLRRKTPSLNDICVYAMDFIDSTWYGV